MKSIKEWSHYFIDTNGTVWSQKQHGRSKKYPTKLKRLAPRPHSGGYLRVSLCKNGKIVDRYIHRLVLETFIGPCPQGMQCCHNDGNKHNNRLSNLRWDTLKNNAKDKIKHGTDLKGFKHTKKTIEKIKLTKHIRTQKGIYNFNRPSSFFKNEFQIHIIRHLINFKTLGLNEIGNIFGTDRFLIWKIKHNKSYKYIL